MMLPFWVLLAVPTRQGPMPLYVYILVILVFVFFASHGGTIAPKHVDDHPSPWYLPQGFFRVFLILVTAAVVGWRLYQDPSGQQLLDRLTPDLEQVKVDWPYLTGALAVGFMAGWAISRLLGPWRYSPVYQDLQAAISIIAMVGLSGLAIVELLINPTLPEPVNSPVFQAIVIGIVAWYFGARS
jgi:hypothetical protein